MCSEPCTSGMAPAGHYNKLLASCTAPNTRSTPRDSLTKAMIEPNGRHCIDPGRELQRLSSIKGDARVSKGNLTCGARSKITSVRFGLVCLLPEIALLGADVRPGLLFTRAGDEDGDLLYTDREA
jgi:hypothetical protein